MPKLHKTMKKQIIDLDFAEVALRDFFANSDSRTIRFFAPGEPTIAFKEMCKIWEIAKEIAGDELRTEIETNGYFGNEIADWIDSHVDYLWISCDGPPTTQDAQRPLINGKPSSHLVHSNIVRFTSNNNLQTGVRATIEASELENQIKIIEFFQSLGVKYIAASPTYHSKPNPSIVTPSLLEFAKYFEPAFWRAKDLGMLYLTLLIVNFDEEVDMYCQASIPTPRITTDGYVSCCDWAAFGSDNIGHPAQKELIYGYWNDKEKIIVYDESKINRIQERRFEFLSRSHCKRCPALRHCVGGCVGKMMAATDDLYKPSKDWCEAVLYLFKRLPIKAGLYEVLHP
jgi:radical SAM protein with 4Fe4S-binding SPASM domain